MVIKHWLQQATRDLQDAGKYIAGEHFTAADLYVGSHIGYGLQFGTLPKLAELSDYFERVSKRPARARADELDNALMKPA